MEQTIYTVKVLKDSTFLDIASVAGSLITAFFTVGLFFLARAQLKNLIQSNTLKTVLDLEAILNQRKSKINEVSSKLRRAYTSGEKDLAKIYSDDFNAAMEDYLNALDRLSYCILKGYLTKDNDWKLEYQDLLRGTVCQNESYFGLGTPYKNILKLFRKWNDA